MQDAVEMVVVESSLPSSVVKLRKVWNWKAFNSSDSAATGTVALVPLVALTELVVLVISE